VTFRFLKLAPERTVSLWSATSLNSHTQSLRVSLFAVAMSVLRYIVLVVKFPIDHVGSAVRNLRESRHCHVVIQGRPVKKICVQSSGKADQMLIF
jgi:hypothetical protein